MSEPVDAHALLLLPSTLAPILARVLYEAEARAHRANDVVLFQAISDLRECLEGQVKKQHPDLGWNFHYRKNNNAG